MAIYRHTKTRKISNITLADRLSNQISAYGTDIEYLLPGGIFFLELLVVESSKTVILKDGNGETMATGLTGFSQDHSPILCEEGFTIEGDAEYIKGFVLRDAFE